MPHCFLQCCLQNVVSKSALQFKGNSQHDAQEFLLWLLDRVHEDLNQIVHPDSRPPRKVNRNLDCWFLLLQWTILMFSALSPQPPVEEEPAPEGSPLPAPGSFVQELFQAQYRWNLTIYYKSLRLPPPIKFLILYMTQKYHIVLLNKRTFDLSRP